MPHEESLKKENKKYKKRYKKLVSEQAFNKEYIKGIKPNLLKSLDLEKNTFKKPDNAFKNLKNGFNLHKRDKFYGFFHRSDKKCFTSLENTLESLSSKMDEKIPDDPDQRYQGIEDIDGLFFKTIENCKEYLVRFCSYTITREAKSRKHFVQLLLNRCNKERLLFKDKALELMHQKDEKTQWKDILAESRMEHIDITDRGDLGKEGAVMSDILTIGKGEDMKFFKDEEKLMSNSEAIDKLFPSVSGFFR